MGTPAELNQFLADIEKRAYAMAVMSVSNRDDALDIVQDVMMTLARRYARKPAAEWRPLFYRMLKNRITDFHRARKLRTQLFGWVGKRADGDETDPVDTATGAETDAPEHRHITGETGARIAAAVAELPHRQQQAFLLRAVEGMDVRDTAQAMGCSEGSVKTHYSRAISSLREVLEEYADE